MKAICISALLISLGTLFFVLFAGNVQGIYNQEAVAQEEVTKDTTKNVGEAADAEQPCEVNKSTTFSVSKSLYLTDLLEIPKMTESNKKLIIDTAKQVGLESLIFQSSNVGVSNYTQQPGQSQSVYSVSYSASIMHDDVEKIIKLLPLFEKAGYIVSMGISHYTTGSPDCSL